MNNIKEAVSPFHSLTPFVRLFNKYEFINLLVLSQSVLDHKGCHIITYHFSQLDICCLSFCFSPWEFNEGMFCYIYLATVFTEIVTGFTYFLCVGFKPAASDFSNCLFVGSVITIQASALLDQQMYYNAFINIF